jgi:hypothetical protein
MTERRVFLLVAAALLVIAGALWISSQRHLPRSIDVGGKLFPALSTSDLKEIDLIKAGGKRAVTLVVDGNQWTVAERDRFPADAARVRGLVLGIADATIVEEKTSDPKNYPAIGVEDITAASAGGTQVELKGASGSVSLIIGRSSGAKASFVRKPGTAQSLLATPQMFADSEPKNWLHRPIVDVASDRVQEARVTVAKNSYTLARKDRAQTNFALVAAPKGKVLASDTAGNVVATALGGLELDDVKKFDDGDWRAPTDQVEFRTFDGWVIGVDGRKDGDRTWIHLTSRYDEALAKSFPPLAADVKATPSLPIDSRKAAAALAALASAWTFEVPKYKYDTLFKPLDDIVKKP